MIHYSTETSAPYCRTYIYPSDVRDYRCASTPATRGSSVFWTYDGQDNPGFSTTVLYDVSMTTVDSTTSPTEVTSTEPTTTTQSIEPTHKPESKTPVGAIIGGVVGGLAVVGVIILGAIFLLRRRRSQNESEAPPPPIQPEPAVDMTNTKPPVGYDPQSPSVASPVESEWRGSSVISPQSTTISPVPHSELSAAPPGYSGSIHELSGDQDNVR